MRYREPIGRLGGTDCIGCVRHTDRIQDAVNPDEYVGAREGSSDRAQARTAAGTDALEPRRPVRVLCLVNRVADNGGAEVSTVQTLRALQGQGISFGMATLFDTHSTRFRGELEEKGVEFFSCHASTWIGRAKRLRQAARRFFPDVIHSTLPDSDLLARAVAATVRVPHMSSLVNPSYSPVARKANGLGWRLQAWRLVDGWSARHGSAAFHAITRTVAEETVKALRIDPRRITVVPRGRSRATLGEPSLERRRAVRAHLGIDEDAPVILNLARQVPQKGQVHLIRAFAEVQQRHPDAVLLVAGRQGSASLQVERAVVEQGVERSVRLLGIHEDVGGLLSAADLFAFSSLYEGFGGALAEAMAMEVPIVAFDVPAVREVVGDGGRLVPVRDHQAMAAAICDLLSSPHLGRTLADRGRSRFERCFTIEAVAPQMRELYRSVAGAPVSSTAG
jgi:glycosyltransferase involved in cell wall biosynthesis